MNAPDVAGTPAESLVATLRQHIVAAIRADGIPLDVARQCLTVLSVEIGTASPYVVAALDGADEHRRSFAS